MKIFDIEKNKMFKTSNDISGAPNILTNSSKLFETFDKSIWWLSNLQLNLKHFWDDTNILHKISNFGLLTHNVHKTTSDDNFWHTVNSNIMKPNNKPHRELQNCIHMETLWQEHEYSERHNVLYERQNYKIENVKIENHKNARGWNKK